MLFILTILAVAQAGVIKEKCDGVFIRNIYHEREVLKDGLDKPYQLAVDFDTKLLFFSFSDSTIEDLLKSAYINLKTNDFGNIPGIKGGFAHAVDTKNHVAYLGGADGIYTFDFDMKTAKHIAGDDNIWQMFFKDRLYYTDFITEKAYYYENGEIEQVEELKDTRVMVIALDKDDNILFSNSSGLFMYRRDNTTILDLGEYTVNGFTTDISGNIYFSTPSAMYSINGLQIVKLIELKNVFGMAIDGENNIIYAAEDKIIKLTPSKKACCVDDNEIKSNDV